MSLSAGANDVSALPAGFYRLTPGVYGGPFLSSTSLNSAPVEGAMGIICDDKIGYVVSEGENLKIHYNGLNYVSSNLDYQITGGGDPQDSHGAPKALVQSYADYINQLTDLLYESAQAAMVMWSISAQANDSNILLSPSSIIPNLTNVGINAAQAYALYILSLDQIAQYNANYGGQLQAGMTKVSAESLDLYCHGTIYNADGTPAVSNAIFTPYVYLTDWLISANQFNTFGQNGLIMIWDIADTAIGWDIADADDYQAVVVSKGMYFMADEILYEGATVQSIKLDVDEVQRISVFDEISWQRPDTPAVLDASILIMIIMIELGIILALLGYIMRYPPLIIIGAIIALVGVFASEWIARVALGLEGFWDWLPWRW